MDYARTLMMEKNISLKYYREDISTTIYTLNCVQVKKGTHSTPFELWYGYAPNLNTLRYLEANVTFLKNLGMVNLMQKVKKEYSLAIPQE